MVTQYGMVESLGCINYSNQEGYQKSFSNKTGHIIDQEVSKIINNQYTECKEILTAKKDKIEQ